MTGPKSHPDSDRAAKDPVAPGHTGRPDEEALQQERNMLRTLIDILPDYIYVKDLQSRFVVANAAVARLMGAAAPNDLLGKTDQEFYPGKLATEFRSDEEGIFRTGRPVVNKDEPHVDPAGNVRAILTTKVPLKDGHGKIVGLVGISRDITDLKQATEALRKAHDELELRVRERTATLQQEIIERERIEQALEHERYLLHALMDNMPDSIYFKDAESRFLRINNACAKKFGLRDPALAIGKTDADFFSKTHAQQALADEMRVMHTGEPLVGVEEMETYPDGSVTWCSSTKMPLRDATGRVVGTLGISRDITAHKLAEQALAEQQQLLQSLMDYIPDSIYFKDIQSRFIRVNKAKANKFGLSDPKQWEGKTDFDFFTEQLARQRFDDEQQIIRTGTPVINKEEKETWPHGHVTWVSTSKLPLRDQQGRIIGTFGLSRDITAHKLAELALEQSAKEIHDLYNNAPCGYHSLDENGVFVQMNDTELRWLGYTRDEVVGKMKFPDLITPKSQALFRESFPKFKERGWVRDLEFEMVRKDGTTLPVLLNATAIKDAQGRFIKSRTSVFDITKRKRAEEALSRTAAELARSNADLEQFAYIASHDLQEPLRMVTSYLKILAEEYHGKLDAEADESIAFAVDGAKRMQTLIEDLLAYSRVGTKGKPFAPTDCGSALERALENLQVAIQESGAVVTHDPLPTVMADAIQLIQLFQNLIGNGIKFHGQQPPRVHVSAEPQDGEWRFEVRDNGIGLDMKYAGQIFLIFQRLHTRAKYPGTGIGLAVCKKIVERHGGRIWVESQPRKGSTFFFTLPKKGQEI